jgi:hypothetical protein
MIVAREVPSLRELGVVDEAAVAFLREHVTRLREGTDAFLITPSVVATLEAHAAPPALVAVLQSALASASEVEVWLFDSRTSALGISGVQAGVTISPRAVESLRAVNEPLEETGGPTTVRGYALVCSVCKGTHFEQRSAQLHSAFATFLGFEWLGPLANCYVCTTCRHVEWFLE